MTGGQVDVLAELKHREPLYNLFRLMQSLADAPDQALAEAVSTEAAGLTLQLVDMLPLERRVQLFAGLTQSLAAVGTAENKSRSAPIGAVQSLSREPNYTASNQLGVSVIGRSCKTCVGPLGRLWPALMRQECWITQAPQRCFEKCEDSASSGLRSFGSFIDDEVLSGLNQVTAWAGTPGEEMDSHMLMLFDSIFDAIADAGWDRALLRRKDKSMCLFTAMNVDQFVVPLQSFSVARVVANLLRVDCRYDNIDAACSSGYLALQRSLDQIQSGGRHEAIVGGVRLQLEPEREHRMQIVALSPSGIMRPLDAQADGMTPAEAASAVILQQCAAAGVSQTSLKGWASVRCNARLPFGSCDSTSMAAAAAGALSCAGLDASRVAATHLHAMGSPASDLPELQGIVQAFGVGRSRNPPLTLAGHKGCIGHSEHVAGLIGLMTTCLVAQHNLVPGHVNVKAELPLVRNLRSIELPTARPMQTNSSGWCSLSGTSLSGDNVHLILGQGIISLKERLRVAKSKLAETKLAAQNEQPPPAGKPPVDFTGEWVKHVLS